MGAKAKRKPAAKPKRPIRHKPESLRLRAFMPALTANDVQASVTWYCDTVGFVVEEMWKHEGRITGATLKAGVAELLIVQDDWAQGRDRKKGVGFRLVCPTAQDVDTLAANIKTRGGVLASEPADQPWGGRSFALVDPDGFKITITTLM